MSDENVKLSIPDPIKGMGKNVWTDNIQYVHKKAEGDEPCNGELEISSDGNIICPKCQIEEPLKRWNFLDGSSELELLSDDKEQEPKDVQLLAVFIGSHLFKSAGKEWVIKLFDSLKESTPSE